MRSTFAIKKRVVPFLLLAMLASFCAPLATRAEDTATALQARLKEIEAAITIGQQELAAAQSETRTLASALDEITRNRSVLLLQIEQADLRIRDAEERRTAVNARILENEARREELRAQLASLLVAMNKHDAHSPLFAFLSSSNVFDALNAIREYGDVTLRINQGVTDAKAVNDRLVEEEKMLEEVAEESRHLLSVRSLQEFALGMSQKEQNDLLLESKGKERSAVREVKEQKAEATKIRTRIYQLLETGSTKITFGEAVEKAKWVSGVTGIQPAFLLSVLTQESNLGANVGTCNRPQDPPAKHWKKVMKPTRDQEPFVMIMSALGKPTDGTPISCPMRAADGTQIGWGGAMGPAQFIPSTWLGYGGKISAITGKASDPWNINDAFLAAALKLTNDGADGTTNGNWTAAMRYFSGSTNEKFRFYGDQVIQRAKQYQKDIEAL